MKKQKTEKLNTNKGITLIALVITIIVMLILVAVTITMAVNGGLFDYAGKATGDTQNAINKEQELGNLQANMTVDELIDKYTSGDGETGGITAATMQSDLKAYLGQTINYGIEYDDQSANGYGEKKWEIFYADNDHIYIITKGHLAIDGLSVTDKDGNSYNGTSDFTAQNLQSKYPAVAVGLFNKTYDPTKTPALQYAGVNEEGVSYDNMKGTQYLLDSNVWSTYTNELADWAIGGPTLELFVKSYNEYYSDKAVTVEVPTGYGYANPLSDSNSVPQDTYLNHYTSTNNSPKRYWLACPSTRDVDVKCVDGEGFVKDSLAQNMYTYCAFRPVVCLKSNVKITWNETTLQYDLSL